MKIVEVPLPEDRLCEIAERIRRGETYESRPSGNLSWFDASRRGIWVVNRIRKALDSVRLETDPDFESAYIDSKITFKSINTVTVQPRRGWSGI